MRKRNTAAWLALLLGWCGGHHFYLENETRSWLYLCFFWTSIPLFLGVYDGVRLLSMTDEEFDELYNRSHFLLTNGPIIPVLPPPVVVNVQAAGQTVDLATQLERLHALYEKGILSADEYAAQKAKLLS